MVDDTQKRRTVSFRLTQEKWVALQYCLLLNETTVQGAFERHVDRYIERFDDRANGVPVVEPPVKAQAFLDKQR